MKITAMTTVGELKLEARKRYGTTPIGDLMRLADLGLVGLGGGLSTAPQVLLAALELRARAVERELAQPDEDYED